MKKKVTLGPVVPQLPVPDIREAQQYYKKFFGFEIGWEIENYMGAVSREEAVIFFIKKDGPFEKSGGWINVNDPDSYFEELSETGAMIVQKPEDKPWGLREFTVEDLNGHQFRIFREIEKMT